MEGKKLPARQVLVDLRSGLAMLKVDATNLHYQSVIPINWKSRHLSSRSVFPLDLPQTPSFG